MRKETQKYHHDSLALHQSIMFETLIHQHNLVTDTMKAYTFENEDGFETEPLRGYLALKEAGGKKYKYFIEEEHIDKLPIRAKDCEEYYLVETAKRKSIVLKPCTVIPFKINPEQTFNTVREFVDEVVPFQNSEPRQWTLLKICAIMGYVGKTFLGISSPPEFGKSSTFGFIHSITQKSPVFQPRSVPGVLKEITGDGNMIFDEVHESDAQTKRCMENFTLQVGDNKPIYINGAMKMALTKSRYAVAGQSINYLYNTYQNYKDPENEFFDFIFSNNDGIDSRLLKLYFSGKMLERFDKDFDMVACAEENKLFYIAIAKELLWLKQLKMTNGYVRRWSHESSHSLIGRKRLIYNELTWLIDQYSHTQAEYVSYCVLLDGCITNYKDMAKGGYSFAPAEEQVTLKNIPEQEGIEVVEEEVEEQPFKKHLPLGELHDEVSALADKHIKKEEESAQDRVIALIRAGDEENGKGADIGEVLDKLKISESFIDEMLRQGEIYECSPGRLRELK